MSSIKKGETLKILNDFALCLIFSCGVASASETSPGERQETARFLIDRYAGIIDQRFEGCPRIEGFLDKRSQYACCLIELYCAVAALSDPELRSGYLCANYSEVNPAVRAELNRIGRLAAYLQVSPYVANDLLAAAQGRP